MIQNGLGFYDAITGSLIMSLCLSNEDYRALKNIFFAPL
jgi:hypothetical protein